MPDTFTANYNMTKPEVNASRDTWGTKWNSNLDTIDGALKTISNTKLGYDTTTKAVSSEVNFTNAIPPKIAGVEIATKTFVTDTTATRLPTGIIVMWSGTVASIPAGWALCDGLNGTPDLRSKFIYGAGSGTGFVAPGATGGSTTHNHGGATAAHTLTLAQIPAHKHGLNDPGHIHSVSDPGHTHDISFRQGLAVASGVYTSWGGNAAEIVTQSAKTGISILSRTTGITMDNAGSGGSHTHSITTENHVPPYYALAFIMKL